MGRKKRDRYNEGREREREEEDVMLFVMTNKILH